MVSLDILLLNVCASFSCVNNAWLFAFISANSGCFTLLKFV